MGPLKYILWTILTRSWSWFETLSYKYPMNHLWWDEVLFCPVQLMSKSPSFMMFLIMVESTGKEPGHRSSCRSLAMSWRTTLLQTVGHHGKVILSRHILMTQWRFTSIDVIQLAQQIKRKTYILLANLQFAQLFISALRLFHKNNKPHNQTNTQKTHTKKSE